MSTIAKKSTVYLFSTIGFYSIIVSFLYTVQKKLIFRPDSLSKDHTFQFDIPFEEFNLEHENGQMVNSLYFPSEESKALVIYFHGNSRNLQHWGNYLPDVVQRGYDVVAIDYRGYGKSDGDVSEEGMYEDAELVYAWAEEHHPNKKIILWGRSLGTGVASHLSTHHPAEKLILETPFYNMPELVKTRFPILIVPVEMKYKFPNHLNIQNNKMTTLIIQGTKDFIVPLKSASKLKKILETEDHFFTIEGAGHRNLHEFNDYQSVLDEIL
ncbi:alpha/beta hydrolase [Portibacter marinus]|uniref:alpha/beta hydrolase n=1 Tax=Portibacter marinus TaxID=2898660 RepID=UPI001F40B343|nr:alpha/beta fold hydrolase [Portibacter marinus]